MSEIAVLIVVFKLKMFFLMLLAPGLDFNGDKHGKKVTMNDRRDWLRCLETGCYLSLAHTKRSQMIVLLMKQFLPMQFLTLQLTPFALRELLC